MKIHDREGTPNPARIRIVLAKKGLEDQIEFVNVDLIDAEQKRSAFLAMNPIGKDSRAEDLRRIYWYIRERARADLKPTGVSSSRLPSGG